MVERRVCTFCGVEIEPGTGRMYVKKDGVTYNFCSSKCFKNLVELGRVPRRVTWTRYYEREKSIRLKTAPAEVVSKKRKTKKVKPVTDEKVDEAKPEAAKDEEKAKEPSEAEAADEQPEAPKEKKSVPKKAKAVKKDEEA